MVSNTDILIKNVTIVDGSGNSPYKGSICIKGEKISTIGKNETDATEIIDANGLVASPGFIDAHSHADMTILWYPNCESFAMQGVTSFIGGNCGISPAPLGDIIRVPELLGNYLEQLDPHIYYPKTVHPLEKVNQWMERIFGWMLDWNSMSQYFTKVKDNGISVNYAPLVGNGNIRLSVMGEDYKRDATSGEIDQMVDLVHQSMREGCIGLSAGFDYDPDAFASKEEIIENVSVLKEYDGVYSPHWRRTGRRRNIKLGARPNDRVSGIKECIQVARITKVPLQ
ncbi:MAG: amidohydrolase family protein, partial [Candidatus Hodarchaeota archaeon]